ncbi:MAG TPA: DoxX family protein [Pyrinomonadaceae bacterium]|nr:DoxX family protein [Pyrinomonadaceae bacterium]
MKMFNLRHKDSWSAWALLPLRLIIGFGFMSHGYAKLSKGVDGFADILQTIGVPAPVFARVGDGARRIFRRAGDTGGRVCPNRQHSAGNSDARGNVDGSSAVRLFIRQANCDDRNSERLATR